jgi:D-beta-D-heptose 7-phosphate kinase / D-beta-D-heptose 1-phosphate adenosyltransferase
MNIKIPDFTKARILIVGDVMLDRYWYGDTSRVSPEAPVPVVKVKQIEERAGGAGNVALNAAKLGAHVTLIGITGNDAAAQSLEDSLTTAGINCKLHRIADSPTITKLRVLSQNQQLIRLDFEKDALESHTDELLGIFKAELANVDAVILSDYGKGTLNHRSKDFIKMARKANIPIFVDPKSTDFSVYHNATVITPNFKEFQAVVGTCKNEEDVIQKANTLVKKHKLDALLITRGEHGMTLIERKKEPLNIPTHAQEVYDVTGAGDTVIAAFAASMASGLNLIESMKLANTAAGIAVSKLGSATVSVAELCRNLSSYTDGIMAEEQLLSAIEDAHISGEKVVMTNGCFDILHAGHVHYLEQAKKLGDRLIIAVNDDASVAKLKGENRPINNLEKRMQVLAGLKSVNWVVPFSEETPERLINKLLPDILVKGGDYKPEEIAGADAVLKNGGEVKILGFIDGCSTTSVIENIKDRG